MGLITLLNRRGDGAVWKKKRKGWGFSSAGAKIQCRRTGI